MRRTDDTHFAFSSSSGFTLIEIIVVLFLISLIAGITVVSFAGPLASGRLHADARNISSTLKHARTLARSTGTAQTVIVDLDARTFGIEGKSFRAISQGITPTVSDMLIGERRNGRHYFRFYPWGGIDGTTIGLHSAGRSLHIKPDPVSGARLLGYEETDEAQ